MPLKLATSVFQPIVLFAAATVWYVAGLASEAIAIVRNIVNHWGRPGTVGFAFSAGGRLLPATEVNFQNTLFWQSKFSLFEKHGTTGYHLRSFISRHATFVTADADAAKVILSQQRIFAKPIELYQALSVLGHNVVVSDGEEWRRFHSITAPAFSEKVRQRVWEDTARHCALLVDHMAASQVLDVQETITKISLMIIASAAFGHTVSWPGSKADVIPTGHQLTFYKALGGVASGIALKGSLPASILNLPIPQFAETRKAYAEYQSYTSEIIKEHRSIIGTSDASTDLLSLVMLSSDKSEPASDRLTDQELIANIFVFMMAGYETTAHTICAAIMCVAMYPEVQERIYQEVSAVFQGSEASPAFSKYEDLTYTRAAFYEASRLFPAITAIAKTATRDTVLSVAKLPGAGEDFTAARELVSLPAGTNVRISVAGVHYNPLHYPDPEVYEPARFLDTEHTKWDRDSFLSFSRGARGCMGEAFAVTEGTLMLALIVRAFKLSPADPTVFAKRKGESERARRDRVYRPRLTSGGITLEGRGLKLKFERRA